MYLARIKIKNFRQFGDEGEGALDLHFRPGITALVGPNDAGKSTVIDAIRYVLRTRDHEYIRLQHDDFHVRPNGSQAEEIAISCTLEGLSAGEKGAFIEFLSYRDTPERSKSADSAVLEIHWVARRRSGLPSARRWYDLDVRTGTAGKGPPLEPSVRELLTAAYLRPLRDAEHEMSAGRGSRLSQILFNTSGIQQGDAFDPAAVPQRPSDVANLSLVGLDDYMRHHIRQHAGVRNAEQRINDEYLRKLALSGDALSGAINVAAAGTEEARLQQVLERLELGLSASSGSQGLGRYGLGSNNLLFMACELLLLGTEDEGLPLLLVEEPEAHLHPQRQLQLMRFLNSAASGAAQDGRRAVQVILTTHSPNLASKIHLDNLVLLHGSHAFALSRDQTRLQNDDYRFLERFLDVTKANLFFANAVLIVEGTAEEILLPTLAALLGRNLTEHGVSVVNVGGTGLRRFSKIFQRKEPSRGALDIPVACVTDLDVMPDCTPKILDLVEQDDYSTWTPKNKRRWRVFRDFGDDAQAQETGLGELRNKLEQDDGGGVKTFVADHWTLEYALAYAGLAKQVHLAATMAKNDGALNSRKKRREEVAKAAEEGFTRLQEEAAGDKKALCSRIYKMFKTEGASKAVAAQYLAEILESQADAGSLDAQTLRAKLPSYLVNAIEHVTPRSKADEATAPDAEPIND